MKKKLYLFLSLVLMLASVSCSDDDDDVVVPEPEVKDSYVSRVKFIDLDNPGADVKTIKIYYDNDRRVTGVHWGTTVEGPNAWKIIYGQDRVEFQYAGDTQSTSRYVTTDKQGKAVEMFCSDGSETSRTQYLYAADTLVSIRSDVSGAKKYDVSTNFKWAQLGVNEINSRVSTGSNDSLLVRSKIIYDEFAPNNANIDFNVILDILNGMNIQYDAAPMLVGMCGHKSPQLLLRHICESSFPNASEKNETRSYQVLSYSLNAGRIDKIEVENKNSGRHYQLLVVYKSND